MILNALEGKPLPVYGDGKNVRDWLYVEDHCAGLARVMEKGRPGERYNLGGGTELTNLRVVAALCETLERNLPARGNPAFLRRGLTHYRQLVRFVEDRPGHDRRYSMDFSKARRELGWSPRHGFKSGMERTVQWYLSNLDWCEGNYERQRLGLKRGRP
jgi:dTDP-glucose 4,6-dehydratase